MKCFKSSLITVLFVITGCFAANAQKNWMNYGKENEITDIAVRGDYIWCATSNGLVRWDKHDMTYRKFTMKDGLPHSIINSLDITPDGVVWCGTEGGLARYDGSSWQTFKQADGLPENTIRMVAAGPDSSIWAGTFYYTSWYGYRGNLARYKDNNFTTWNIRDDISMLGTPGPLNALAVSPDNTVLMAGWQGVLPYKDGAFQQMYSVLYTSTITTAPDGTKWAGTDNGIYKFIGTAWQSISIPSGMPSVKVGSLVVQSDGSLWGGTPKGLLRFDGTAWKCYTTVDGLSADVITSLTMDESGLLYIGTPNGLCSFDGVSFHTYLTNEELISSNIYAITFESYGAVWVGTSSGISWYNGRTWRSFTTSDGLPDNVIISITVTPKGDVWAATSKGAARFIGPGWKTYTTADGLADSNVISIASGTDNSVWFGTSKGITRFDGTTWNTYSEPGEDIRKIVVTPDGTVCCASSKGLSWFNGSTWKNHAVWVNPADPELLTIAAGFDNTLYFLTSYSTSVHYQSYSYSLMSIHGDSLQYVSNLGGRSCSLAAGKDGTFWLGTQFIFSPTAGNAILDNGGITADKNGNRTSFFETDGLATRFVNTVAIAPDGAVWVGTNRGLSRYGLPMVIGVESEPAVPEEFTIVSNFPNPFNPSTTISFALPLTARVELTVYSITGQNIRTIVSGQMTAGTHSAVWNGRDNFGKEVSSGVYLAQLRAGKHTAVRRMALVK